MDNRFILNLLTRVGLVSHGAAMSRQLKSTIREWFKRARFCDLVLPSGMTGKAGDCGDYLTYLEVRPHKLIIELNKQLLLVLTDCKKIQSSDKELVLSDFVQLVYDWQGFGDMTPHVDVFTSGEVRFLAPPRITRSSSR